MRQVNLKKYVLPNLPYLFVGLYATKLGQAWRLSSGMEFADKVLHLMDGFATAFQSAAPSFHPSDLLVGLCCGAGLRLAVYIKGKNAKKYTTAQSTEQFNIFVKAEVSTNRLLRLFFFPGIFTRTANGTMLCLSAETEAAHRDMLMCEERRKVSDRTLPALINLIRSAMRETAVSSLSLKHP